MRRPMVRWVIAALLIPAKSVADEAEDAVSPESASIMSLVS